MEKAEMLEKLLKNLVEFLARRKIIDQTDATTIVGGLMNQAADAGDMDAHDFFEEFEEIMFRHASPRAEIEEG
jgi:hypothetical protein